MSTAVVSQALQLRWRVLAASEMGGLKGLQPCKCRSRARSRTAIQAPKLEYAGPKIEGGSDGFVGREVERGQVVAGGVVAGVR